jgi:hypothetical protein
MLAAARFSGGNSVKFREFDEVIPSSLKPGAGC